MKRALSLALTLLMVVALATTAFAAEPENPKFNVPVYYTAENAGSTKPAESFTVTLGACSGVTKSTLTTADAPTFTNADNKVTLAFTESTNAEDVQFAEFVLDATSIKGVGVFTYPLSLTGANNLAGLTYDTKTATLTVSIVNGTEDGKYDTYFKVVYDTEKVNGGKWNDTDKKYEKDPGKTTESNGIFNNIFSAAAPDPDPDPDPTDAKGFTVSKTVTGNFGDKTKDFNVTVTFTCDKNVTAPITYVDGESKVVPTFTFADNKYSSSVVITIKHGETITFSNVPYGVSYTVVEDNYTSLGYATPDYTNDTGTINAATVEVSIVNDYDSELDTGILLDIAPYALILAFVAACAVYMVAKKRKIEEI